MRRRSLLKALGLGGLAGFGSSSAVQAADAAAETRSLVAVSPYLLSNSVSTSVPDVGALSVLEGPLLSEDGKPLGRFHASRVVIQTGSAVEVVYFEQHMFQVEGGTLFGTGRATRTRHTADEFTVTGGLGAFLHARGSYRMSTLETDLRSAGGTRFEVTLSGGATWH